MATPTTLLEYATQQQAASTANKDAASTGVRDAQDAYSQASKDFGQATKDVNDLQAQIAAIRKELANITTPADAAPLLQQLSQKMIDLHAKQAAILDAEMAVKLSQAEVDRRGVELNLASTNLTSANSVLADAKQKDKQHADLKNKLGQPPLDSIIADATTALTGPPFTDAKTRIETDIPAPLIARARERLQRESALLDAHRTASLSAVDLINAELNTNGGLTGKTEKFRSAFERAEDAFLNYVTKAKERYDTALAMLSNVADASQNPLTPAEAASLTDPNLQTQRDDAAKNEKARDDARADVQAKQAALDKAILDALAADIDADPNSDTDVQNAQTALGIAEGTLTTAEQDYTAADRKVMDEWEAAVPDATWQQLAAFEEAKQLLTTLKNADPAQLVKEMDDAETALVNVLLAMDKSARSLVLLKLVAVQRAKQLEFETGASQRFAFRALRGDI